MNFQKARLFPGLASSRDGRRRAGLALGRGSSPPSDVAGGRGAGERGWLLPPGESRESFPRLQRPPHIQARPAPPELRAPSRLPAAPPPLLDSDGDQGPELAAPAAAAAPAASLGDRAGGPCGGPRAGFGLGAADRAALRARGVSAHRAQRRLRALPLRGDVPRRPKVRLQVPRPARQPDLRGCSARFPASPSPDRPFPPDGPPPAPPLEPALLPFPLLTPKLPRPFIPSAWGMRGPWSLPALLLAWWAGIFLGPCAAVLAPITHSSALCSNTREIFVKSWPPSRPPRVHVSVRLSVCLDCAFRQGP